MGPLYIYLHVPSKRIHGTIVYLPAWMVDFDGTCIGKYTIVPWIQKGMVESVKTSPETNNMQLNVHISLQLKWLPHSFSPQSPTNTLALGDSPRVEGVKYARLARKKLLLSMNKYWLFNGDLNNGFIWFYHKMLHNWVVFHPQHIPETTKRGPFFIAHLVMDLDKKEKSCCSIYNPKIKLYLIAKWNVVVQTFHAFCSMHLKNWNHSQLEAARAQKYDVNFAWKSLKGPIFWDGTGPCMLLIFKYTDTYTYWHTFIYIYIHSK